MTEIHWDSGTAYDFFISLFVLHNHERFGLRAQWAAGVRSRIPLEQRVFLEDLLQFMPPPLAWTHQLEVEDKNAASVLNSLRSIAPEARLLSLLKKSTLTPHVEAVIKALANQSSVTSVQIEVLREYHKKRPVSVSSGALHKMAEACMQPAEFGERLLKAFETYYEVFFKEEEERITALLKDGLMDAQEKAKHLLLPELMEDLSHGVSYESVESIKCIHLVPSYWSTPLVFTNFCSEKELLMLFGCRKDDQNLIPGEYVPESLMNAMKVLSDGTRLRILRYLNESPDSPSGLAKKLRLRPPTVVHHLHKLRLAGLVHIIISQQGNRMYALRKEALKAVMSNLKVYLETSESEDPEMDGVSS